MRTFLIVLVVLLIAIVGYTYNKNPTGCLKIVHDFGVLFVSVSPVKVEIKDGVPAIASAANSTDAAPGTPSAPATPLPLPPNSLIQNGDFSQGATHWEGDGVTPRAYAAANPSARMDPLISKGLIVTLNPTSWTRIYQTFPTGPGTQYSIVVNYRLSPSIALSKDAADYVNISKRMQVPGFDHYGSLTFPPGRFYGTVGDPNTNFIALEVYVPRLGSSDVQTYQHTYPPVPVSGSKTFALAYPPGTGTVVILSTAVTSE